MNFKIVTLSDNTIPQAGVNLIGEHGLAFYIETENRKILFDTGQGIALSNNARILGVDLSLIDTVILSHGHIDHSGGLKNLLTHNRNFVLHAHPDVFDRKLRKTEEGYQCIGIPDTAELLARNGIETRLEKIPVQIAPGVMTTGEIPLQNDFEQVESVFHIQKGSDETAPDSLADDLAVILDSARGLVVLLGCCHRGLINTLNHVVRLTGKRSIHAVLGGLHLGKASDLKLKKITEQLAAFDLDRIGVGHCTGFHALVALSNRFQDRVFPNMVGNVLEV